jgi:ABC-type multidrug transport system ATPase subunit/pSer/pThr/pTyr-binding forkhead associated (FHA) protein
MSPTPMLEVRGLGATRVYALGGQPLALGRAADNAVVLDDAEASRYHARVEWVAGQPLLTDLGSANGTTVNGESIPAGMARPVRPGDTIGIASLHLALLELGDAAGEGRDSGVQPLPGNQPAALSWAEPARPTLSVRVGEEHSETNLVKDSISLGRDPANDIVIDSPVVSRRHAQLERTAHGYRIVDLGSANGLTQQDRAISRLLLVDGDVVQIADDVSLTYRITPLLSQAAEEALAAAAAGAAAPAVPAPAAARPEPSPGCAADQVQPGPPPPFATLLGEEAPVSGLRAIGLSGREEMRIGRGPDNDLRLDNPTVSRHHAILRRVGSGEQYVVEDLRSSNGTWVNDELIEPGRPFPLLAGSTLRIGPVKFLLAPEAIQLVDESRDLRLDAVHLKKRVGKGVNLLQDISLAVLPREFVAVVGVSGAGKSTLLNALAGIQPATDGAVLVNRTDLYRHFNAFRTDLGYVPQDDIIHKELTTEKALEYAARLRLPPDLSAAERRQAVVEELSTLGLKERANVRVGSLSGGQRKRVSIAVERLTRPGLFYLDEATSGLDPGTEHQLMTLLRQLADAGQTILLVTHATKNVMLCDQVVFLAKGGNLAFFGPPGEALHYFGVTDFDEIYEKLQDSRPAEEWAADYRASPYYRQYVVKRLQEAYGELLDVRAEGAVGQGAGASQGTAAARPRAKAKRQSSLRQFLVLSSRYLTIIRSDRTNLVLLLLIAPLLGSMDLIAWPRDIFDPVSGDAARVMTMLFLASIIPFLVGSLSSVREIVKEKAIYLRERTVNLALAPYLLSKIGVGFLFALYHAGALLALKVVAVDFSHLAAADIGLLYVVLVIGVMSGVIWGLLVSAVAPREEQAMLLVIIVVVVQMVFSGGILSLDQLGGAGKAIGAATSSKWTFEALIDVSQVESGDCSGPSLDSCLLPGVQAYHTDAERQVLISHLEDRFGDVLKGDVATSIVAQLAIMVVLCVLLAVVQKRKDVI